MMSVEDFFKSSTGKGFAIGIAAAILAPVILPAVVQAARPLARAAIKSGILLLNKGRETAAELGEVVEDLVAEARAEIDEERARAASATATTEVIIEDSVDISEAGSETVPEQKAPPTS
ncbi:DUF5132 domain-containing protein [Nitrosomonas sp. Is37]|uniref:DUF5132 domain-containing protein n=1 Tax=Nitrosomonas sp. Is37 TaxID=3080535 RepID=UPI00294B390A|nr:DUF5132 domain-containing protein [Nitrosomonas sp. Is37]MDV6343198.1 DUF5132 domain-containing protein [Nitrosomonas sp. Is37]